VIGRRPPETALHDHPVALAGPPVTGRAEHVEAFLPARLEPRQAPWRACGSRSNRSAPRLCSAAGRALRSAILPREACRT
jgi:hypothetical protein